MKNTDKTKLILILLLLVDFVVFAQPGTSSDGDPLEGVDASGSPMPLDNNLILLGTGGTLYVLYFFFSRRFAVAKE